MLYSDLSSRNIGKSISKKENDLTVLKVLRRQSKINWNSFHSLLLGTRHFVFIGKYRDCTMLYLFLILLYNSLLSFDDVVILLLFIVDNPSKELKEDIFAMIPNKFSTSFIIFICFSFKYISIISNPIS